ncbi:phosphate signaling complex protein PhoU [Candidatus Competibacter phosphatis]|mgnify:CR=1 FL=1|jgi:phosphate transport system protein|uniref:Phosphate-specific transport system accessory protein PhoU n=1 Tax=Candidatus Competibacter phosphatis TaxID=221280 RepID=A0ABX1TM16_9GAMM|nr:phosphate signaling complex protein PhoU [Candidatus Competibacter phosphatis]MCP5449369.1 phosphate signaling complex protein PhoU [Gammaproteobacteria bacterium]MDG4563028.1 phosphate signaling complex protein PhoU [Candidatus Competibacter sp.]NMQ20458.1 phosphate signaling complex protein PhoU [Candidatus Competibacter phosphatis]
MPISHDAHTVKQFDAQLANLRNLVLEMGGLVEDQIKNAVKSLDDEDLTLAREVIARDQIINGLQVKIDEDTITLIATRQPVGSDLRLIMSLSKAVTDLERIGDEAEKIARMTIKTYDVVSSPPSAKLLRDVTPMAKLATDMLHGCLDALARVDVEMAVNVARGDDNLDQEFQSALRRLITYMMEDPRTIGHAISVLFIIKALERIGDHAKNIAEYIIYLVKGKDVRHVSMDTLEKDALAE